MGKSYVKILNSNQIKDWLDINFHNLNTFTEKREIPECITATCVASLSQWETNQGVRPQILEDTLVQLHTFGLATSWLASPSARAVSTLAPAGPWSLYYG